MKSVIIYVRANIGDHVVTNAVSTKYPDGIEGYVLRVEPTGVWVTPPFGENDLFFCPHGEYRVARLATWAEHIYFKILGWWRL